MTTSEIILLLAVSLFICIIIGRIVYYRIYIRPDELKYENLLMSSRPDFIRCDNNLKNEFIVEIENYESTNDTIRKVEEKAKNLPFPIPLPPNNNETGEDIISKLISLMDKNPLAFVGTEQFILSIFPSEQIGNFTFYALESITDHSSQAVMENIASLKASLAEGITNFHDSDKIIECLKNFGSYYLYGDNHVFHLQTLMNTAHENGWKAIGAFLQHTTMHDFLLPMMNYDQHISEITHSWIHHTSETFSDIENFDFDLDIDPTGHFPFITLFVSGSREIRLISNNKTSMENSLKNVLLDVGGTGLGALGGAKAGAVFGGTLGSFFPGFGNVIGASIGGIIGGIAGAMGGRKITNNIKCRELNLAISNYRSDFNQMLLDAKKFSIKSVEKLRSVSIVKQKQFIAELPDAPYFDYSKSEIIVIAQKLVMSLKDDLHNYKQQLLILKNSRFSSKIKYNKIIQCIDLELDEINSQVPSDEEINENPIQSLYNILDIPFLRNEKFHTELPMLLQYLKELIRKNRAMMILWGINANNLYKRLIYDISIELNAQADNYNRKCLTWKYSLDQREKLVQKEREKLGM